MRSGKAQTFGGPLRAVVLVVCLASAVGCKETKVQTPERNLNRPTKMSFFCAGPVESGGEAVSALSAELCDASLWWCEESDEVCEEILSERSLFGLILNTSRGELGVADLTNRRLLDLASGQPGYRFVPVGSSPTDVAVTPDGCGAYTINGGSCDITAVNTTQLLRLSGFETTVGAESPPVTSRIDIRTDSGRLLTRPAEMIMVPGGRWPPPVDACQQLQGHSAYVSFPACGLVAEIDLDTGRIVQSIRVSRDGIVDAGTDPSCPKQCPDHWGDGVDGGTFDHERPMHLAYRSFAETGRGPALYVAPENSDYVAIIDVAIDGRFDLPSHRVVTLEDVRNGIRSVKLSPVSPPPNDWSFLYVMTRDGDIRVVDTGADPEVECETNPDPRDPFFDPEGEWFEAYGGCIPVGDVSRAPLADSPGIDMPDSRQPVDVAFFTVDATGYDADLDTLDPARLNGMFAYAVTMDGLAYVLNVDERFDPLDEDGDNVSDHFEFRLEDGIHAVLAHQIRNANDTRAAEDGRPRIEESFIFLSQGGEVSDPPAGVTIDQVVIDDSREAKSETWSLIFEDILPGGASSSGYILKPNPAVDDPDTAELRDSGSDFCRTGVEEGDVVVLEGCEEQDDCGDGFTCLENPREGQENGGVCVEQRYAADEGLVRACLPLAQSSREYEVLSARDDSLVLATLPAPGTPCDTAADCSIEGEPGLDFVCDQGRCGVDCSETDSEGRPVQDCAVVAGVCRQGRCIKGPLPDERVDLAGEVTWCMPTVIEYEIRAAYQYVLFGSETGTLVARVADPQTGQCVDDQTKSGLYRFRIALTQEPFSNPIFTLFLDGTENGDELDREDGIIFEMIGGFEPGVIDVASRLPSVAKLGPDGYVYIVDMGNDVETAGGVDGQVLRLEPAQISIDEDFLIR